MKGKQNYPRFEQGATNVKWQKVGGRGKEQ